ncbi:LOW QUALITY PROTEIN: hypothetical protein RJ640_005076, partial [Escallonia rubra]
MEDRVGLRNFKVFAENDKGKVCRRDMLDADCKRKSVPAKNMFSQGDLQNLENKAKRNSSVKINVRRKVLADISNVRGNIARNELHDGFKPVKGKSEKVTSLPRTSVIPGTRAPGSSSSKPSTGNQRGNLSQAVADPHKRVISKDLKVSSGDQKTKVLGSKYKIDRKSLPVIKRVNEVGTTDVKKGDAENLKINREKSGFPGRQHKVDTQGLSRKSVKVKDTVPSDGSKDPGCSTSDLIARRKSERRKSFTSLLLARSKLLKEHGEVTEHKFLPNIYDDCNHLEVAEYVDEIYGYYWVMEILLPWGIGGGIGFVPPQKLLLLLAQNQSLKNYMEIQTEISPQMRGILVNWLIEVHLKFDLMQETLYLMVTLLDRYLSLVSIKKNEMQLVGLTALLLASKYEDFWHPRVLDLISISAESYTRNQMLGMEGAILKKLKFRLNAPTPYVFMLRFNKAAQSDKKFEHLAFYLIELSLVEYEALNFKPSLLCASAIYIARCTLQITPAWTPLLVKHTCYEESQIRHVSVREIFFCNCLLINHAVDYNRDCAEMILRFHKAARTGMLKVTYEKFMRSDYSRVAAIKPLERKNMVHTILPIGYLLISSVTFCVCDEETSSSRDNHDTLNVVIHCP